MRMSKLFGRPSKTEGTDYEIESHRLLVQAGKKGVAAGALGEKLGIPPATLSFHLKTLTHAKLIKSRTEGRFVIYSANFSEMDRLISYLTEHCCAGDAAQCAPIRKC